MIMVIMYGPREIDLNYTRCSYIMEYLCYARDAIVYTVRHQISAYALKYMNSVN